MENRTGLPYDLSQMDLIRNNGAIVDMNNINFPNVDNQVNVAFIFLRNTDYNVTLDFSNCSYDLKKDYLLKYLTESVEYKINSLINTWMAILCSSIGILLEDTGILTKEELQKFVDENIEIIGELLHLIISVPVYIVSRFNYQGTTISTGDIKTNDSKLFNDNINYLFLHPAINIILETDTIFEPENYVKYFTNTNDKLFSALQGLPYMAMLVGMVEKTPEEWENFLNEYKSVITE